MTQSEAISLVALVISGLIGALWLMLRERIKTLEERVEKEAGFRSADALRIAKLESQHEQREQDAQRVEKTLEQLVAKIDELKVLVARMEERERRAENERRKQTPEGGGFRFGREPEKK